MELNLKEEEMLKETMEKSKDIPQPIDPLVIKKRSEILRQLSARKRVTFYQSVLGTTQKVLIEQKKKGVWTGFTDNYIRVEVTSAHDLHNDLIDVKLAQVKGIKVVGRRL